MDSLSKGSGCETQPVAVVSSFAPQPLPRNMDTYSSEQPPGSSCVLGFVAQIQAERALNNSLRHPRILLGLQKCQPRASSLRRATSNKT